MCDKQKIGKMFQCMVLKKQQQQRAYQEHITYPSKAMERKKKRRRLQLDPLPCM
jgi:hypothetical protein